MKKYNIIVKRVAGDDAYFQSLIKELDKELWARYDKRQEEYDFFNKIDPSAKAVVIFEDDLEVACGCFKVVNIEGVELKRMFVAPDKRGRGYSKTVVKELENWAKDLGFKHVRLETGTRQPEAIGLYNSCGYVVTEKFEPYVDLPESICFAKNI